MDTTIEREFFKAFEMGGVVSECIDWVRDVYNVPCLRWLAEHERKMLFQKRCWSDSQYIEATTQCIVETTEDFNDFGVTDIHSPLMEEIEKNLIEVKENEDEKNRYLFDILSSVGNSRILYVFSERIATQEIEREIENIKEESKYREMPNHKKLADDCKERLKTYEKERKWRRFVVETFWDVTKDAENGTIEHCLSLFQEYFWRFANHLDALLLKYGIDLLELQNRCNIYLIVERDTFTLAEILGSNAIVQYYIDRLPKPQQEEKEFSLPTSLDVGEAQKYINRAIEIGWIEINGNSGKWLFGGVSRLAYFCLKVFAKPRPISDLERFFGVKSLAGMISNIENEDKDRKLRNDVRIWREEMDNVLFYD